MIDLEHALVDLAEHLDHPDADDLVDALRRRLVSPVRGDDRRHDRSRALLAVAAVFALVVIATLAISPSRHAIADWLGIGAVEVRRTGTPPRAGRTAGHTVPGSPHVTTPSRDVATGRRLAAVQKIVAFEIATPRTESVGAILDVEVDRTVPGGLVALRYTHFTLVEAVAYPGSQLPIAKLIDPAARVEPVTVAARPGLWITGAHVIAYLDRSGHVERDSVRRSGPVLIWERSGVTYRIEGFNVLADAETVAAAIR